VTLAAGHGQTISMLIHDITKQGHHIQVMADVTVMTVTLAVQHECTTQVP